MADEDNKNEETDSDEETGKKGGLKKIILLVVGALLIAGISIGATIFLMPKPEPVEEDKTPEELMQAEEALGEDGEPIASPPVYLAMKPAFIANYAVGSRQRYLQMEISLFARDQETIDMAKTHEPLLRNNIISILGAQQYDVLRTKEGKLALVESITVEIQDILLEEMGRPGIEKILLTSFVLQ